MIKDYALHISLHSFILFIFIGCQLQSTSSGIEDTLTKAQNNRNELLKVLQHFRAERDSLKSQAALFLLENMADKYYFIGCAVDEYYTFIDSVYQIKQPEYDIPAIYEVFLQNAIHLKEKPILCRDAEYLSADYLIKNINEAFAVWHQPWNQHLSFEEFCEYILLIVLEQNCRNIGVHSFKRNSVNYYKVIQFARLKKHVVLLTTN